MRVRYGNHSQDLRLEADREEALDHSAWAPQPQTASKPTTEWN